MYISTTPLLILNIPYTESEISNFIVSFAQKSSVIFEKEYGDPDVELEDYKINIRLSSDDTCEFTTRYPVFVQIKMRLSDETIVASNVEKIDVHRVWNDEDLL